MPYTCIPNLKKKVTERAEEADSKCESHGSEASYSCITSPNLLCTPNTCLRHSYVANTCTPPPFPSGCIDGDMLRDISCSRTAHVCTICLPGGELIRAFSVFVPLGFLYTALQVAGLRWHRRCRGQTRHKRPSTARGDIWRSVWTTLVPVPMTLDVDGRSWRGH